MKNSYVIGCRLLFHQVQVLEYMRRQLQQQEENEGILSQLYLPGSKFLDSCIG
jgi:hypothetical protein